MFIPQSLEDPMRRVPLLPGGQLIGGEDLINNPPAELKDGARVTTKKG